MRLLAETNLCRVLAKKGYHLSSDVLTTTKVSHYCSNGINRTPWNPPPAQKGQRKLYFGDEGGWCVANVYDRYALATGRTLSGPAVVEERETTVVVGPSGRFTIDDYRNLVIELGS